MLIFIGCLIALTFLMVIALVKLRKMPTSGEKKAVIAVADYTLMLARADQERVLHLKKELKASLSAHGDAVNRICAPFRQALHARVDSVVDKEFLHSAYKSAARKKWKQEFEGKCNSAVTVALELQTLEPKLNDMVRNTLNECERKSKNFQEIRPRAVAVPYLDDKTAIGLARMIADEARLNRFLGDNPALHDAARTLFGGTTQPKIGFWERINPREWLASFESPGRVYDKANAFVQELNSKPFGVHDVIIDATLVVGILHTAFHLGTDTGEAIVKFAMHAILAHNAVFLELIYEWVKQWIVEQFGEEVLQEVLTIFADIATGLIILTALWRGYRYYKLAKKLASFWNGDDILPKLRVKFRDACVETLEKLAEDAKDRTERSVNSVITSLDSQIAQVSHAAITRRAWALTS